tara:strand:- start:34906 stop:36270 length:1365 start_codon:yes stop_codon:yes gene_type:complete
MNTNTKLTFSYLILFLVFARFAPVSHHQSKRLPANSVGKGCYHLFKQFTELKEKLVLSVFEDSKIPKKYQKELLESFKEAKISDDLIKEVVANLNTFPKNRKDIERTKDYLLYLQTLFPDQKKKAFLKLEALYDGSWESVKDFKKFRKTLKKFDNYEQKQLKRFSKKEALQRVEKFKKLYKGCNTKGMTLEHAQGGKAFTAFTISIAALSSGAFYTYSNYDDPEFLTKEFFGKLSYEMTGDALWAALASWVFKDPSGTFLKKSIKMYLADNTLIFTDALVWEQIFGEGETDAKQKIEELKKDPEAQIEMEKLVELLKREKFMDKLKEKFSKLLVQAKLKDEKKQFDLDTISLENLDDPEVQELMMEAALKDMYEDESGEMSLGTYGADRYAYYSMIGIPFMFIDTFVTTRIYQTMCMAPLNPKMAIMKAALIFSAYSIMYDTLVYPMRKTLIGE